MSTRRVEPATWRDVDFERRGPNPKEWGIADNGLAVPVSVREDRRPTCIDLFAGAGGFSLGFMQAGWRVVAALENEPNAALTYLTNLGAYPCEIHYVEPGDKDRLEKAVEEEWKSREKDGVEVPIYSGMRRPEELGAGVAHLWFGDVRKVSGKEMLDALGRRRGEVDAIIGGPPCQGFSTANTKRSAHDPRNSLVFEFVRLVLEIRPATMVMENVPQMVHMMTPEGVPVIDAICKVMEDGDFGPYKALREALLASSGAGAAMRAEGDRGSRKGSSPKRKGRKQERPEKREGGQLTMDLGIA